MEGQGESLPKTYSELFEKLLPICLKAGLTVFEFWDLTLGEITIVLNNYKEEEEKRARETAIVSYNQATMIADFVSLRLNGKPLPSYEKLFPSAKPQIDEKTQKEQDYKRMMLLKEQMMFFAEKHNKNRRKKSGGDGL